MAHFDDWVTDPAVTRAGVEAFVADKTLIGVPYLGRYFVCVTSGTTGIPGLFPHDLDALKVQWATGLVRRYRTWMTPRMTWAMLRAGSRMAMLVATKDHFQGVNASGILRLDNFDRPFVLSSSVKNHLAPSGLERQHWCANQCDPNADQCAPAEN